MVACHGKAALLPAAASEHSAMRILCASAAGVKHRRALSVATSSTDSGGPVLPCVPAIAHGAYHLIATHGAYHLIAMSMNCAMNCAKKPEHRVRTGLLLTNHTLLDGHPCSCAGCAGHTEAAPIAE